MSKVIKKNLKPASTNKVKLTSQKISELQNVRIMQKNLVYVIGLSAKIASSDILFQKEYFGQYGKIIRLIVNNTKAYTGTNVPSYSAYITFSSIQEAAMAILAVDYTMHDDLLIRASFGSTKYCSHFLRNVECTNKDCVYYHYFVDDKDVINNKDDTSLNSRRQLLAIELSDIYSQETRSFISKNSIKNSILPNLESIYRKDNVIENDYSKSTAKHVHSSNGISNLKSILNNKDKSPKIVKEDLNNLFNKKKKTKLDIAQHSTESNETSTNSNSRHTSSPNEEKFDSLAKSISCELVVENSGLSSDISKRHFLFSSRSSSRFSFAKEESTEDCVVIPPRINDIIKKKTSTYFFLKDTDETKAIFDEHIIQGCEGEWKEFILSVKAGEGK